MFLEGTLMLLRLQQKSAATYYDTEQKVLIDAKTCKNGSSLDWSGAHAVDQKARCGGEHDDSTQDFTGVSPARQIPDAQASDQQMRHGAVESHRMRSNAVGAMQRGHQAAKGSRGGRTDIVSGHEVAKVKECRQEHGCGRNGVSQGAQREPAIHCVGYAGENAYAETIARHRGQGENEK